MEKLDQSYSSLLNYTNRNIKRYATEQLRQSSLPVTVDQWGVLKLLEENQGHMNFAELSARMLRDKPTLTRIVDILVRRRLVKRGEDPDDRRRLLLSLTPSGWAKVEESSLVVERLRKQLARGLTKSEHAMLKRILAKINANIERARSTSRQS